MRPVAFRAEARDGWRMWDIVIDYYLWHLVVDYLYLRSPNIERLESG
jgi:hypothetical protein